MVLALTKQVCGIEEIAKYLDVSVPLVRKLVRAKMIPYFRIGNRLKFKISEIEKWIENKQESEGKNFLFI